MSHTIIRSTLETMLNTWAGNQNPAVPVAWQSTGFTKPVGTSFLEPFLIPNTTMNNELSGERQTYLGLYQVNCWAPSGQGMRKVEQLAQSIVDLFPIVPKSGFVSIEGTPSVGRPIEDEAGWVIVPVLIKYRYEAT